MNDQKRIQEINEALSHLLPREFAPARRYVRALERTGGISPETAALWTARIEAWERFRGPRLDLGSLKLSMLRCPELPEVLDGA